MNRIDRFQKICKELQDLEKKNFVSIGFDDFSVANTLHSYISYLSQIDTKLSSSLNSFLSNWSGSNKTRDLVAICVVASIEQHVKSLNLESSHQIIDSLTKQSRTWWLTGNHGFEEQLGCLNETQLKYSFSEETSKFILFTGIDVQEEKHKSGGNLEGIDQMRDLRDYVNGEIARFFGESPIPAAKSVDNIICLRKRYHSIIPQFCIPSFTKSSLGGTTSEVKVDLFTFPKIPPVDYLKHLIKD